MEKNWAISGPCNDRKWSAILIRIQAIWRLNLTMGIIGMLLNGKNNAIYARTHHYLDFLIHLRNRSPLVYLRAHIRTKVSCRPATDRSLFRDGSHHHAVSCHNRKIGTFPKRWEFLVFLHFDDKKPWLIFEISV